jgi:hypothetical protein
LGCVTRLWGTGASVTACTAVTNRPVQEKEQAGARQGASGRVWPDAPSPPKVTSPGRSPHIARRTGRSGPI